jgi:uncharacterized membrane protein
MWQCKICICWQIIFCHIRHVWKQGAWLLVKPPKFYFFVSTHGAPTLVDYYTYIELNKDVFFRVSMWQIHVVVMMGELLSTWQEYTFVRVYFAMSSKSIMEYSNWHGWNIIGICLPTPIHKLTPSFTLSPNSNQVSVQGTTQNVFCLMLVAIFRFGGLTIEEI